MMFFHADWSGACRALLERVFADEAVVKASENFVRLLLDVSRDTQCPQKYAVPSIPAVLFFNPDGKEVDRLKSRDPEGVAAHLQEVAQRHRRNPRFHREYGPARDRAKEEGKPLAIFFYDARPGSQNYARALDHESLAKPEQKPYRKIYGSKTASDLRKNFEEALKQAAPR